MMGSGGSAPSDAQGVFSLLAVLANPEAAKQHLEQVAADKKIALDTLAEAHAVGAKNVKIKAEQDEYHARLLKALDESVAKHQDALIAHHEHVKVTTSELDRREQDLGAYQQSLTTRQLHLDHIEATQGGKHAAREKECERREHAVLTREEYVAKTEKQAAEAKAFAETAKADWERRVEHLKAAGAI
jgi:hypothetical protein